MYHKKTGSYPGFGVVELIVVVAILGLLVGILLPLISSARRSARVTLCASNLRQIGQALLTYAAEQHRLPSTMVMPPPFKLPPENASPIPIYEALDPYLSSASPVYRCPEDGGQVFDRCAAASPTSRGISYLYIIFPSSAPLSVKDTLMWDYQGSSKYGLVPPFHRGGGINNLLRDGSVHFLAGNRR